ncbi:uncharacterized protein ndufv3 [Rhinoraja longicauda]
MAAVLRLGGGGARRMLFLGRLGLQVTAFTTKAPGPQKKKKKVKGPRAQDVSHGISLVRTTDMTAGERAKLLTTKTLLHFPRKTPGPPQAALTQSWQEAAGSRPAAPEHGTQTVAARHPGITQGPVGAESDSSSDSDEETVTGNALKRPVRFLRHNSPVGSDDWSKERKQVEQRAWASRPQSHLGIAVSSSSERESDSSSQPSCLGEKQVAQVALPEAPGQRNAPEVAATPASARSMDQDSRPQSTDVLLAQRGTREREVAVDDGTSTLGKAADTSLEPVKEPADEVLDTSTYKNTQHHDYTPLTFVDLDMEMAKYRLPQPSSGRLTPRH